MLGVWDRREVSKRCVGWPRVGLTQDGGLAEIASNEGSRANEDYATPVS